MHGEVEDEKNTIYLEKKIDQRKHISCTVLFKNI